MTTIPLSAERVFAALPVDGSPIPAIDLTEKLGLAWPGGARDVRAYLLLLREEHKAEIRYGYGWYRTTGVEVPA